MRARYLVPCVVALAATVARADHGPRGQVRLTGWHADVDEDGGARSGGTFQGHLDLTEHLRLDLAHARTLAGPRGGQDVGFASARWRALHVGGGVVGDDRGLHVGVAPRLSAEPARWLLVEGGLHLSLGAGWLDGRSERGEARGAWRHASRGGVDVWAASTGGDLTLRLRPHEAFEVAVGAYVDAFAAAARPGDTEPLPSGVARVARRTDLGVTAALSQGALGAHGTASLRLLQHTCMVGTRTELWLRYREAWDWIHLDPVYSVLAETDPFDDVSLLRVPWRVTRTVELHASRAWARERHALAAVEVRHTAGSTTVQDFADRDGWSAGARVAGRWGRVYGAAHARWHLAASPLEPLLGPMPRLQVGGQAGLFLVSRPDLDVALEVGVEHGRQDDWGVPRRGWAAWGGLQVSFGGARHAPGATRGRDLPPLEREALARAPLVAPLPRTGGVGRQAVELWTARSGAAPSPAAPLDPIDLPDRDALDRLRDLLDLDPDALAHLEDPARDAGLLDDDVTPGELREFLDDPAVEQAVEAAAPGLADVLRTLVTRDGDRWRADGAALLRQPRATLFSGYGLDSAGVGVAWDRRLTLSRTWALHGHAGDDAPPARDDDLLAGGMTLHRGGVLDLARTNGWQKVSVARREGERHRVVFQGATGWTRAMRWVLSGR
ncbi:MAG: hypothetical protein M9894_21150 [Planctomycetes bacterium]|nr:hypothetical protein [Planctomycetota bacterium]